MKYAKVKIVYKGIFDMVHISTHFGNCYANKIDDVIKLAKKKYGKSLSSVYAYKDNGKLKIVYENKGDVEVYKPKKKKDDYQEK